MTPPDPDQQQDLTGLIHLRKELVAAGLTDNGIAQLRSADLIERLRRGAYVDAAVSRHLSPEDRHRLLARAVLRTAHPDTVLSHYSSILERGVPLWGVPLQAVHTTRAHRERAARRVTDWKPHRAVTGPDDIEVVNGVTVTRPARAAVETTMISGTEVALIAVNRMLHAGVMTKQEYADEVEACRYWPNTLNANVVLKLCDPRLESVAEDRFLYFVHRAGLPLPEPQLVVLEEGKEMGRVDFGYEPFETFVEIDGRIKYTRYRLPDESLHDYLMREKRRQEQIALVTGWTCVRVTWEDLSRPQTLARRLRKHLTARKPRSS